MTNERRKRRSEHPTEALELLLESVRDRSEVSSLAVVDGFGQVVAGTGPARELEILGVVAAPAAWGVFDATCEDLTVGTDVVSCPVALGDRLVYLAGLGDRVARMSDAVRSAARILSVTSPSAPTSLPAVG